jgi:hypothetical protein
LSKKCDAVRRTADRIVLTTQSTEGTIREAELTLTPADYRATRARLWLSSHTPIEIVEEKSDGSGASSQVAALPDEARGPHSGARNGFGGTPLKEAADTTEADAWLALAQLHLLDGWKATILRNGERIEIFGAMDAATREEIAKAIRVPRGAAISFDAGPPTESLAPGRASFSDSPPLGAIWIRQELPPGEDATGYTNRVLATSQEVLGLANSMEWLEARRRALRERDAIRLGALADRQKQDLIAATGRLVELLRPLLDSTAASIPLLSREKAYRLDAALIHVFASGPAAPRSLASELADIESVLPVRLRPL